MELDSIRTEESNKFSCFNKLLRNYRGVSAVHREYKHLTRTVSTPQLVVYAVSKRVPIKFFINTFLGLIFLDAAAKEEEIIPILFTREPFEFFCDEQFCQI